MFAWIYFPDLIGSECCLESLIYAIVTLLDYELIQYEAIATKIEAFVHRIAYRDVKNMICLKNDEELGAI